MCKEFDMRTRRPKPRFSYDGPDWVPPQRVYVSDVDGHVSVDADHKVFVRGQRVPEIALYDLWHLFRDQVGHEVWPAVVAANKLPQEA